MLGPSSAASSLSFGSAVKPSPMLGSLSTPAPAGSRSATLTGATGAARSMPSPLLGNMGVGYTLSGGRVTAGGTPGLGASPSPAPAPAPAPVPADSAHAPDSSGIALPPPALPAPSTPQVHHAFAMYVAFEFILYDVTAIHIVLPFRSAADASAAILGGPSHRAGAAGGGGGGSGAWTSVAAAAAAASPLLAAQSGIGIQEHEEADIFLSESVTKPSVRNATWSDITVRTTKLLGVASSDPCFPRSNELGAAVFYAAITAFGGAVKYTLRVDAHPDGELQGVVASASSAAPGAPSRKTPSPAPASGPSSSPLPAMGAAVAASDEAAAASAPASEAASNGVSATSASTDGVAAASAPSTAPAAAVAVAVAVAPPGMKICDNCGKPAPEANFAAHSNYCRRHNWCALFCNHHDATSTTVCLALQCRRCPACAAVVQLASRPSHVHCPEPGCPVVLSSPAEAAKHALLTHAPWPCDACGEPVRHAEYEAHLAKACPYRRTPCTYCGIPTAWKQLAEHEAMCVRVPPTAYHA